MSRCLLLAAIIAVLLLCTGCTSSVAKPPENNTTVPAGTQTNTTIPPGGNTTGIPNPASQFCAQHNGTLEIREDGGGQYGVCSFWNGAKCEEWAYYRGECSSKEPNFCEDDADCGCGVHIATRDCFYGQKEFVDEAQQCPDFCNGIAAHLEIKCIQNRCTQVQKNRCKNFTADECPVDCVVCPPCAECSSIGCQSEEFCSSIGFGKDWYNGTRGGN